MITDFLETKRTKEELKTALEILLEFKSGENTEEWLSSPFVSWVKLEQLEEYLQHLVNGSDLKEDTVEYINSKAG